VDFPTCHEKMGLTHKIIEISTHGVLTMNCTDGGGWYWLGTDAHDETIGAYSYIPHKQTYTGPVQLTNNEEWAFGT
jgi:hypothetical protein